MVKMNIEEIKELLKEIGPKVSHKVVGRTHVFQVSDQDDAKSTTIYVPEGDGFAQSNWSTVMAEAKSRYDSSET